MLNVPEVADVLRISETQVYRLIKAGHLESRPHRQPAPRRLPRSPRRLHPSRRRHRRQRPRRAEAREFPSTGNPSLGPLPVDASVPAQGTVGVTTGDPDGYCEHRWPYLPHVGDPRVTHHICGRRIGHRLPHRCRDCNAETSTQ